MVHKKIIQFYKQLKESTSHTPVWFMRQAGDHNQNIAN